MTLTALEVAIMQLVHVVEGGERSQMSKRSGRFRHPRRADRRHRRRRGALLHAAAQPRHHGRPGPRAGAQDRPTRTRSTTSSTPTPGSRASCARPGSRRRRARSGARRLRRRSPVGAHRAGADQAALRAARRGGRDGRAARPAPALRLRDGGRRATSTPSTATVRSSGRRARGSRRRGSASAC